MCSNNDLFIQDNRSIIPNFIKISLEQFALSVDRNFISEICCSTLNLKLNLKFYFNEKYLF